MLARSEKRWKITIRNGFTCWEDRKPVQRRRGRPSVHTPEPSSPPPPFPIVSQICPCFKITVKASERERERERESKKAGKEKGSKMEEKHSSNFHPIDLHSSIEAPYFSDTEGRTYPYLPTYLEGINSSWNFSSGWTSIIEMTWHKLRLEQLELAESTFSTKAIWKNVTVPIWCLWSNRIYRNVSKQVLNESGAGVNLWPILQIFYDRKLRL